MLEEDSAKAEAKEEKTSAKSKIGYWRKWIKASKKAAKRHWEDAKAAYDEYEYERTVQTSKSDAPAPCYPAYYSRVELLRPAYYSRTPKLKARRKFDVNDPAMILGCDIAERLGEYLLECGNFDSTMYSIVSDFIHADKATGQIIYYAEESKIPVRKDLERQEDLFLEENAPYEGEVFQDEQGYFYNGEASEYVNKKIYAKACPFDKVLHTPEAEAPEEIREMAYFFSIPREEAEERFKDKLEGYSWKIGKHYQEDDKRDQEAGVGEYLEGWECYDLDEEMIYWVAEGVPDFLDSKSTGDEDSLQFTKFFPSPSFIIGSKPRNSLYPTPIYTRLRSTLEQLHKQYAQTFELISSIRRRALVDGTVPELLTAFQELGTGEFITVKNLQELVEKKGLANLVWYLPVKELVEAIGELATIEDRFKNLIDEWFGTPEIMRGVSDPLETASAQEIKTGAAHDRFKFKKKQVAGIARDLIEMMLDAALKVYSDEEIARIVGLQYKTQQDQQLFPQALAVLKDDKERLIRIDIETDSTSFIDERQQQAQVNAVIQTLISGLKEISSMFQNAPEFAPIALQALLKTLASLPGGSDFEPEIRQQFDQIMAAKQQPQQPPPPDPKMLEIESKQNIAMMESQADTAKHQIDTELAIQKLQAESAAKSQEFELKYQELVQNIEKTRLEVTFKQEEIQLKREELILLAQKAGNEALLEQSKLELEDRIATTDAMLEKMAQDLDAKYQMMDEREKLMTEQRLQFEAQLQAIQATQQSHSQQSTPQLPPISINVDAKQSGKKQARIVRDELGTIVGVESVDVPEVL